MKKRVISWLLTVVMVVSLLPTSVLADTLAADQEQQTQQEQIAPVDTENTVPAENEETQEQQEPAPETPVSRSARSGGTALALAAALYLVVFGFTDALVAIFNSENSALMARYAFTGMRIYFIGYLFAGFNIVSSGYLSAVNRPTEASITSISRGVVAIVACSLVLSALFGMNGVWAAFPASEAMTVALTLFLLQGKRAAD